MAVNTYTVIGCMGLYTVKIKAYLIYHFGVIFDTTACYAHHNCCACLSLFSVIYYTILFTVYMYNDGIDAISVQFPNMYIIRSVTYILPSCRHKKVPHTASC